MNNSNDKIIVARPNNQINIVRSPIKKAVV